METVSNISRLLVKMNAPPKGAALSLQGQDFTVAPLFLSIQATTSGPGIAPSAQWHILAREDGGEVSTPWNLCHEIMRQGFGISGAPPPEFAEPDLPRFLRQPAQHHSSQRDCGNDTDCQEGRP
jgi:hypothetical protein